MKVFFPYLDPGSGSYLLQLIIAGAMGGLLIMRAYWGKIVNFVRRLFGKDVGEDED